jgi:hypothetical protein
MNTLWVSLVLVLPLGMKAPDPADVKPGWLGFGLFIALAVATVLLWLSMRRQLKKVNFEEAPDPDPEPPAPEPEPGEPEPPRDVSEQPRA